MFPTRRKPLRILDFDIENRPLHYWYGDATTGEITVIAWAWYGDESKDGRPYVHEAHLLRPPNHWESAVTMLRQFLEAYDEADMVTGHFIRGHDLPMINSATMELGLPRLHSKLTSDTKLDLTKHKYMSVSQKNLAEMLGVRAPKVPMPQVSWRESNRLTDEGVELAVARAVGDVLQHMELRKVLLERNLLAQPKVWVSSAAAHDTTYQP